MLRAHGVQGALDSGKGPVKDSDAAGVVRAQHLLGNDSRRDVVCRVSFPGVERRRYPGAGVVIQLCLQRGTVGLCLPARRARYPKQASSRHRNSGHAGGNSSEAASRGRPKPPRAQRCDDEDSGQGDPWKLQREVEDAVDSQSHQASNRPCFHRPCSPPTEDVDEETDEQRRQKRCPRDAPVTRPPERTRSPRECTSCERPAECASRQKQTRPVPTPATRCVFTTIRRSTPVATLPSLPTSSPDLGCAEIRQQSASGRHEDEH